VHSCLISSLMASATRRASAILDKKYNFFSCKWPCKALLKSHACFVIQGGKELAGTTALRGRSWTQWSSSRGIIDA
jgi:predicted secreted Zn-dependent protease